MKRCVVFAPQASAPASFFHVPPDARTLRDRTLSFGMWVDSVSGGRARLFVDDGAVSLGEQVVSTRGWQWLEMRHTVSPTMERLSVGVRVEESAGKPWRIAEPRLDYGASLGRGAYVRPGGRWEHFVVKVTPDSYFGAEMVFAARSGGVVADVAGETAPAIAEDVQLIQGQLEAHRAPRVSRSSPAANLLRHIGTAQPCTGQPPAFPEPAPRRST